MQGAYLENRSNFQPNIDNKLINEDEVFSPTTKLESQEITQTETKATRKPGRKIDENEPVSKRLAQNRAAQKAFRERRENFVRSLQERVKTLEEANKITTEENQKLINSIKVLEEANSRLQTNGVGVNLLAANQFQAIQNGFNNFNPMANFEPSLQFQQGFSPSMNFMDPNNNLQTPLIDPNIAYQIPIHNGQLSDSFLFPEFPNFPILDNTQTTPNFSAPNGHSPAAHSDTFNPITPHSLSSEHGRTPEPTKPKDWINQNLDEAIMPHISALDIMKPDRPPPTKEELVQLAKKHKLIMDKLKSETYTLDELNDALKRKATCNAVKGFLAAYLGDNFENETEYHH